MTHKIRSLEGERGAVLVRMEIERAAERLIKVHGRKSANYVTDQINIAQKDSDHDGQTFWEKVAKQVEKQLSYQRS